MYSSKRIVSPKKLLNSKWTATTPVNKEKHFIVIKLVLPEYPDKQVNLIEMQAVYSKRIQTIDWHVLNDQDQWSQGWV